jgi:hypothetical protein
MGKIILSKNGRRRKGDILTPEERKIKRVEYQKDYYLAHIDKAKEYQRVYNLVYKKKKRVGKQDEAPRIKKKTAFTPSCLQGMDSSKFADAVNAVIKGKCILTY